jgi:hypothetical protein
MTPVEFRRHIHKHPELSFEEHQTAQFIVEALTAEGISCSRIADTGVVAKLEGIIKQNLKFVNPIIYNARSKKTMWLFFIKKCS